jgi:hypothetical protein
VAMGVVGAIVKDMSPAWSGVAISSSSLGTASPSMTGAMTLTTEQEAGAVMSVMVTGIVGAGGGVGVTTVATGAYDGQQAKGDVGRAGCQLSHKEYRSRLCRSGEMSRTGASTS